MADHRIGGLGHQAEKEEGSPTHHNASLKLQTTTYTIILITVQLKQ